MTLFSKIKKHYISYFLIACIIFNIGLYIYQINDLTKNIYLTKDYKEKVQKLASTNLELSSKNFQEESWAVLERKIEEYNFEKVDSSKYVKVTGNSIVTAE